MRPRRARGGIGWLRLRTPRNWYDAPIPERHQGPDRPTGGVKRLAQGRIVEHAQSGASSPGWSEIDLPNASDRRETPICGTGLLRRPERVRGGHEPDGDLRHALLEPPGEVLHPRLLRRDVADDDQRLLPAGGARVRNVRPRLPLVRLADHEDLHIVALKRAAMRLESCEPWRQRDVRDPEGRVTDDAQRSSLKSLANVPA